MTPAAADVPACRVDGLVKRYRNAGAAAVDGVCLDVPAGAIVGLLGPNGAGKTTLVRMLTGIARPDAGTVSLYGEPVTGRADRAGLRIAYLAQDEPALAEMPVRVAVTTTGRLRGLGGRAAGVATTGVLDELELGSVADQPMSRLSGGQRRLACVAATLVADRPVLVLDEPTTGLDPLARRLVWDAVHRRRTERGTTTLLVTHNVAEAEAVLDRVAVLDRGRVVADDTPGRLKAMVGDHMRLDVVWREGVDPDTLLTATVDRDDPLARILRGANRSGRRWQLALPLAVARDTLASLTTGPLLDAIDDVGLTTPSLEDAYLALGGRDDDLERS